MKRLIIPKIDRTIIAILSTDQHAPRDIPGYRRVRDSFVRSQTNTTTYRRVRAYVGPGTRISVQYQPCLPKLPPLKITLISDDRRNLTRQEILQVLGHFGEYRLLLLEIALDCQPESRIDLSYVRRHGYFGKSRVNASLSRADKAVYGARKASKFVRCYQKEELDSFRIELQLHSEWLRRFRIRTFEDLRKLPNLLCPSHIRFVQIDWTRLREYLLRRGSDADEIIQRARAESHSIHQALNFLRNAAQVPNVHRFLVTTATTWPILRALKTWARKF